MKKIILAMLVLAAMPVFADELNINMTPQNTFSGYYNTGVRPQYMNRSFHARNVDNRSEIMKPKSVREMGNTAPSNNGPMTYDQFPKNYDSSNMMHMQGIQNGMQNMFMGY